ncbi:SGNH/GDSL hydrolase family protein [Candidatus Thorarchaeota archaeon]|nr:MAG: SGNH/GDSL hydrolase family protein [Candidatus Thorarchaeota archaeon]
METILIGFVIVVSAACFILVYLFWQMEKLPKNRPGKYDIPIGKKVVVLAGDSITHGQIGASYVPILEEHLDKKQYSLVNAGVNSHLAWNLLQRVDEIIACEPDYVTIMIGTNDANAATSKGVAEEYMKRMNLPKMPNDLWYRECLQGIVTRLQSETSADIALISIPPIGEALDHPAFRISSDYIKTIQEVANVTDVAYLPLHERMLAYLREHKGEPKYPFERTKIGMTIACFKRYILRKDWDTIGREVGFQLHIDYLHLNTKAASIVAEIIEEFVSSYHI